MVWNNVGATRHSGRVASERLERFALDRWHSHEHLIVKALTIIHHGFHPSWKWVLLFALKSLNPARR